MAHKGLAAHKGLVADKGKGTLQEVWHTQREEGHTLRGRWHTLREDWDTLRGDWHMDIAEKGKRDSLDCTLGIRKPVGTGAPAIVFLLSESEFQAYLADGRRGV